MMDGQVAEIRKALDAHGFYDVGIMGLQRQIRLSLLRPLSELPPRRRLS
jgi:porphobilinogen synthase (EC 4.2.1.24)